MTTNLDSLLLGIVTIPVLAVKSDSKLEKTLISISTSVLLLIARLMLSIKLLLVAISTSVLLLIARLMLSIKLLLVAIV
jgi:hypothetical protein